MSEPNLNDILSGGGLSSLLQNPDIAAKLPRIMEALGPVIAEMRTEGAAQSKEAEPDTKKDENAPVLSLAPSKVSNSASHRRRALLNALEPYLSDGRRDAMNSIGKILTLIDLLSEVM